MVEQQQFKIFVGGLPKKTTDHNLSLHLSKYGIVFSSNVKTKKTGNECLGYGTIAVDQETYFKLINKGCSKFMGRKITFGPYLEGKNLQNHLHNLNSKRIFVRNVPQNSDSASLEQFFSRFGVVETAYTRIIPGTLNPIGVILFINPSVAEQVVEVINNDNCGIFKDMSATYKFLHNRENNSHERSSEEINEHQKLQKIVREEHKPLVREHYSKPGRKDYNSYRNVDKRHGFYNVLLNVSTKNSCYSCPNPSDNLSWSSYSRSHEDFSREKRNRKFNSYDDFGRRRPNQSPELESSYENYHRRSGGKYPGYWVHNF